MNGAVDRPTSATLAQILSTLQAACRDLERVAPRSTALAALVRSMDETAALHAEVEAAERAGQMIVTLKQEAPITSQMYRVMRFIADGGKMVRPQYRHRYWLGWNESCKRGFIGEGRDGYETLTPIGRAKLAEHEQRDQLAAPMPLLLAAGSNDDR